MRMTTAKAKRIIARLVWEGNPDATGLDIIFRWFTPRASRCCNGDLIRCADVTICAPGFRPWRAIFDWFPERQCCSLGHGPDVYMTDPRCE